MYLCEFLILFLLTTKSASIYDIRKFINVDLSVFLNISAGTIVPNLKKLEKAGFITIEKSLSEGGFRKNSYKITQKGKEYFENLIKIPISKSPQTASKEISVFCSLIKSESFTPEQREIILKKSLTYLEREVFKIHSAIKDNSKAIFCDYIKLKADFLENSINYLKTVEQSMQ